MANLSNRTRVLEQQARLKEHGDLFSLAQEAARFKGRIEAGVGQIQIEIRELGASKRSKIFFLLTMMGRLVAQ